MEGRRLLSEGQRAGAIDDVELRDALLLRDAAEEPQAVVERRQGIVAAPDDLARRFDSLGAANLVEARLRLHHAWYELVRVALRRHRPMVARRRDASVEQRVVDVLVRVGNALERPALRLARPERLRRIGEGEVADAIAGRRRRHARHRRHAGDELRRVDRNAEREQAAEIVTDQMALALALDRLAHALGHRVDRAPSDLDGARIAEALEHRAPDVRTARVWCDARHAAMAGWSRSHDRLHPLHERVEALGMLAEREVAGLVDDV